MKPWKDRSRNSSKWKVKKERRGINECKGKKEENRKEKERIDKRTKRRIYKKWKEWEERNLDESK